ncbi:MAG: hypothetical protein US94_C0022G0002 [Berkelbacteria bacterium GW2011_GWB1_38_5]|uniref:DUF4044 domain-containing protein n=2 Tax=Candidatus Berkelbacteria TaxID=1618330 RepID=A0A0G0FI01_9BACT|nr:MAG: hypothetical protein US31_C0002G0008 [Berkelbacteria bacterium GW2011_GWA1_36_9]KKQ73866.1 MAG: hypothetical protein US94_C0022G0002 [Berkelbacteria bacterium GW2011_GWB1_38_5]
MDKKSCTKIVLIIIIILVALGMVAPFVTGIWQ